jgi:hypothetical protein
VWAVLIILYYIKVIKVKGSIIIFYVVNLAITILGDGFFCFKIEIEGFVILNLVASVVNGSVRMDLALLRCLPLREKANV